jgi:hypothetical protein
VMEGLYHCPSGWTALRPSDRHNQLVLEYTLQNFVPIGGLSDSLSIHAPKGGDLCTFKTTTLVKIEVNSITSFEGSLFCTAAIRTGSAR